MAATVLVKPKKDVDNPVGDTITQDPDKMKTNEQFTEKSKCENHDDKDLIDSHVDYAQFTLVNFLLNSFLTVEHPA